MSNAAIEFRQIITWVLSIHNCDGLALSFYYPSLRM